MYLSIYLITREPFMTYTLVTSWLHNFFLTFNHKTSVIHLSQINNLPRSLVIQYIAFIQRPAMNFELLVSARTRVIPGWGRTCTHVLVVL